MTKTSLLRFTGESEVLGRLRLAHGRVYRVWVVKGCGGLTVRAYDVENPQRFADCPYSNLASFMRNWEVVEW